MQILSYFKYIYVYDNGYKCHTSKQIKAHTCQNIRFIVLGLKIFKY